jgi:hypothetical protein
MAAIMKYNGVIINNGVMASIMAMVMKIMKARK